MALPPGDHCTYRPNRSRVRRYTAKDVARIYCLATSQGVSRSDIQNELKYKCEVTDDGCSCEDLLRELAQAQNVVSVALEIGTASLAMLKSIKTARTLLEKLRARNRANKELEEVSKELLSKKEAEDLEKVLEATQKTMGTELDRIIAETERVSELVVEVPIKITP